jgi:acetylornithine deacetylase/succinyl-diaminopimelate desuccinylase-like protein
VDVSGEQRRLLELVDRERETIEDFYRELVRIPSVWGHAEPLARAAGLIADRLGDAGYIVELPDSGTDGMPMVLARRLGGEHRDDALIFNGHMEVYPPSESWTVDPFGGVVRDGRLYGQGAADMKGGTAAMTMACWVLGRAGARLGRDVVLLAIPNHFEGGEGTRKALREGLRGAFAVVCEPTGLHVLTGQRGIVYLTIDVAGRAAHTTALDIGVNAIERAMRVVAALGEMVPRDAAGRPVPAPPIVNVAIVSGGLAHNLVPEACRLTVDIRFPPEQTQDDVLRDVEHAIDGAVSDRDAHPITVEPEDTCVRNPRSSLRLRDDHPLVRELAAAHEAVTGEPGRLSTHPAWPDTPIFNEMGVPAVTYGPGSMECYWDDESVALDEYVTAVKTYCAAAVSLAAAAARA